MKINEIKDKITDYDVDVPNPPLDALWYERKYNRSNADTSEVTGYDVDDPNPLIDALHVEQESNRSNSDNSENDISITISIPKVPNLRKTRKRGETSVTKPIPAEFITFAAKLFNELKDRLLDITETSSVTNSQSDLIVLQSSRNNSKLMLKLSSSEQAELRKIGLYNNIFRDSSDMKDASAFIADDDARSSVEDVSASFSLLNTKLEGKINRLSFATSTTNWNVLKTSNAENYAKEKQKPIINTETKMDGDMEGKKMMTHIESTDDESMFYITKDSEEGTLTDGEMHNDKTKRPKSKRIICKQLKILQLEKDLETVKKLQKKVVKIGTSMSQNYSNRFFEKVVRSDLNDVIEKDNKSAGDNLYILSNSTDTKCSNVVKVKDNDVTEHKRLSFTKNRQFIALGRKELLSNIAKAQAALQTQTSKLALNDNDSFEVDKTMQFDNEPIREESLKEHFPLKETAFGETSYMCVPKEAAVPIYLATQRTNTQENVVNSNPVSELDLEKSSYLTSTAVPKTFKSESLQSLATFSENSTEFYDSESIPMHLLTHVHEPPMSKVLVFDQLNPLNNILLRPNNFREVHKSNPLKAEETLWNSEHNRHIDKSYNQAYRVGTTRDFEVRTMTIQQQRFVPRSAQEANQGIKNSTSYSVDAEELAAVSNSTKLSEDLLHDKFSSNISSIITKKKQKQISTPSTDKHKHHGSVDITPKLQNKSFFKKKKELTSIDKTMSSSAPAKYEKRNFNKNNHTSKIRDKKLAKTKMTKPGQNITVRQLIADYIGFDNGIGHNNDFKEKFFGGNFTVNANSQNVTAFSPSNLSFSSSKNLNPMKNFLSPPYEECMSLHQPTIQSMPFQEDWQHLQPPSSKVLVFDYLNSLNNVFISPFNATKATKYNPMKSDETFYCSKHSRSNKKYYNHTTGDFDIRTETCKQHLAVPQVSITQEENQGIRFSKLYSADTEKQATDINNTINKVSDISLHDHVRSNLRRNVTKNKKRTYSPSKGKHRHLNFAQVTPKPIKKKQKISTSPKVKIKVPVKLPSTDELPHSLESQKEDKDSIEKNTRTTKARDNKSVKTSVTKPERSVTVKQLIAEYTGFDTGIKHDDNNKNLHNNGNSNLNLKSKSFTAFSQSDATFTLSKNLTPMKDIVIPMKPECQTSHHSIVPVMPYQVGWPPELMPLKNDSDSGANVVARIDMLPFMGSHECEWETSLADTWSFRLLHGQLRLMARLAHRLDNATRTVVRGDTPVLDLAVKIVYQDRKDLVASTCIRFACETMRHIVLRALSTKCIASDIPPLLQRCANVVRVALRWKRAMHDAKQRLAYTLDSSGNLSLKVANIPLRSVWEVTMRIGLVLDNYSLVPCPRATNVRVLPVVSDVLVPTDAVRRALIRTPKDWGNVPGTIWRVYRLLKHKKRDDNLLR